MILEKGLTSSMTIKRIDNKKEYELVVFGGAKLKTQDLYGDCKVYNYLGNLKDETSLVNIGVQLIKLLVKHKYINIKYLCGNSSVGKSIKFYDKSLSKYKLPKILKFNKKLLKDVQVIFTALPNGEAQDISKHLSKNHTLIDLAADFRLAKASDYLKWYKQKHRANNLIKKSIYLLPEINRSEIKKYNIISCPGCYPTSILLPLIPLFKKI